MSTRLAQQRISFHLSADTTVGASKEAAEAAAISFLAKLSNETEMSVYFATGSLGWQVK